MHILMELIQNNFKYNFKSVSQFTDQLKLLQEQLPHILDDFEKYYVFYNMDLLIYTWHHIHHYVKITPDS